MNASNDLLKDDLMTAAEKFGPVAYKLVSTSKGISPKVQDANTKQVCQFIFYDLITLNVFIYFL
jgi:hypothetical protein